MATELGGTHKSYGSSVNCMLTQPTEQNTIKARAPKIEVIGFPPAKRPTLNDMSLSIFNSFLKIYLIKLEKPSI